MSDVGQREIHTPRRVIAFFQDALGYAYLGPSALDVPHMVSPLRTGAAVGQFHGRDGEVDGAG